MADSQLEIRIRALVEGIQQVSALAEELGDTARAATETGDSARQAAGGLGSLGDAAADTGDGFGDMVDNINPANTVIDDLNSKIKGLVTGFIALAGVMSLKEAADTAARTETLGVTLGVVGNNAGYSADQLARYEAELKKLGITTGASREALTQLIQAGINLNEVNEAGASTAGRLARASQDLAVVTGENSSDTLTRLILNIRQLDTEGLRYLGLAVNVQAAQESFAASIGKSADALTQNQKQQAVMNAALEEATKLSGSYEASLSTVGKQLSSMSRYQEEAANSVGNTLLPAYGELVQNATLLLKNMALIADELDKTSSFAENFGQGIGSASEALVELLTEIMEFAAALAPAFGGLVQASGELVGVLGDVLSQIVDITDSSNILETTLESIALLVAGLADGLRLIGAVISTVVSGWTGLLSIMATGLSQIVGVIDKDMAKGLDEVAKKLMVMSDESRKSSAKVMEDFANGNTAVQRLIDSLKDADDKLSEFGKATSFDDVAEQIRKLTEAQRDQTMNSTEAVAAGNKIKQSIEELGAQGVITGSQMAQLTSKVSSSLSGIQKAYGETIKALGVGLTKIGNESLFVAINKEAQELGGRLLELAELAPTTSDQFSQAFSKGLDSAKSVADLDTLSQSLDSANMRLFETSNSLSETRIKLSELFEGNLETARTEADIAVIEQALQNLADRGALTEEELKGLFARTAERSRELQNELNNSDLVGPLKALGLSLGDLGTGFTDVGRKGAQALEEIVDGMAKAEGASRLTGAQFSELFNKSLSTAKTVGDLQAFTQELERAKAQGSLFGQTYKDALTEVSTRFNELFQTQLKAANTRAEFDALKLAVQQVGESGGITGTQVAMAMDQINEKATNAKGSILALAKQSTELAQQQSTAARASASASQAEANLAKEQRTLQERVKNARQENTKENKALLAVQEAIVRQAQAEARLAESKYRLELVQISALIAKQRQLNAEKKVQLNPTDEGAQASAKVAGDEAASRELVVERTKTAVAEQTKLVARTQEAVVQAKALAEEMGVASEEAKGVTVAVGGVNKQASMVGVSIASWDAKAIVASLTQAGLELGKAQGIANTLLGGAKAVAAFGSDGISSYRRITDGIQAAITAQGRLQEKAQRITSDFSSTADKAQAIADGVVTAAQAAELFSRQTNAVSAAMTQVKLQAYQAVKATKDSAEGFLASASSLRIELLSAQGLEDEASRARYEQRRQELDLEYQLLRLKIQSAITTAQAAGISTQGLQQALAEASSAYDDSMASLSRLEQVEGDARKKRKDEAAKEAEAKKASLETEEASVSRIGDLRAEQQEARERSEEAINSRQRAGMLAAQSFIDPQLNELSSRLTGQLGDVLPAKVEPSVLQSIAGQSDKEIVKVVEHRFVDDKGAAVTATVPANESARLLDILDEFRRRM